MTDAHTAHHEKLVNDWYALFNGDFSKLEVVAESAEIIDPLAEIHGREELERFIREMRTAFPDIRLTLDDMLAREDVVMAEWTATGTHEGEFNGIAPTGTKIEQQGMEKLRIKDDKIQEASIYFDKQEMLTQLGVMESN